MLSLTSLKPPKCIPQPQHTVQLALVQLHAMVGKGIGLSCYSSVLGVLGWQSYCWQYRPYQGLKKKGHAAMAAGYRWVMVSSTPVDALRQLRSSNGSELLIYATGIKRSWAVALEMRVPAFDGWCNEVTVSSVAGTQKVNGNGWMNEWMNAMLVFTTIHERNNLVLLIIQEKHTHPQKNLTTKRYVGEAAPSVEKHLCTCLFWNLCCHKGNIWLVYDWKESRGTLDGGCW